MTWQVRCEDDVYRHRDLDRVSFPALPTDASGKRGWFAVIATSLASIDRSSEDLLTKWILACDDLRGTRQFVLASFHNNSQGMHLLDRTVGKLMTSPENLKHPVFGIQFACYVEWCHRQKVAPKGRVLVAIVAHRFRLDRNRGKCLNVLQK